MTMSVALPLETAGPSRSRLHSWGPEYQCNRPIPNFSKTWQCMAGGYWWFHKFSRPIFEWAPSAWQISVLVAHTVPHLARGIWAHRWRLINLF